MNHVQDHYVPVLKVKRGEKRALREIKHSLQRHITPLLEIVERTEGKTLGKHLDTAFKDLVSSVRSYVRCFLDCRELEKDEPPAAEEVFQRATANNMVFTPVTGISRSNDVIAAMNHRQHGLAIRLTCSEFEDGNLGMRLRDFMVKFGLRPEEIDLIVDLGPIDSLITPGVAILTSDFLANVPDHTKWRTFTISACGFPPSMRGVQRNSYDFVERVDWKAWRDHLYAKRQGLSRLPTFSDCAIQHPSGVEGFDPRRMQVSASIRYTSSDDWLLIKGESVRNIPTTQQFPILATSLAYGHLHQNFYQAAHCSGCTSIKRCAGGYPGLSSPESWRRFGTIHHITKVVQDLAALPWP